MRRRYWLLLALIVLIGAPYYWLLLDNRPGGVAARPLPLAELRRQADEVPGAKPESVAIQQVGWRRVPGNLFVAGSGMKRQLLSIQAARLRGPWGDVVIDSGFAPPDTAEFGLERYLPDGQAQVNAALRRARTIVFTHEHVDHIGGLLRLPDFAAVSRRALFLPEQLRGNRAADALPWPAGAQARIAPFRYAGMAAIAPGIVLIRDPGHTPGSQMIYARLADGREFLFTGDTATMAQSWREVRARSRLVGQYILGEDRAAVHGWLKAIRALHRAAPAMVIVPGHEYEGLRQSAVAGQIEWGFAP